MAFLLKLDSDGTSFRTSRLRGFLLLILALSTRTCGCTSLRRIHAAPYGGEFDSRGQALSPPPTGPTDRWSCCRRTLGCYRKGIPAAAPPERTGSGMHMGEPRAGVGTDAGGGARPASRRPANGSGFGRKHRGRKAGIAQDDPTTPSGWRADGFPGRCRAPTVDVRAPGGRSRSWYIYPAATEIVFGRRRAPSLIIGKETLQGQARMRVPDRKTITMPTPVTQRLGLCRSRPAPGGRE
jgi:hypothetical protein